MSHTYSWKKSHPMLHKAWPILSTPTKVLANPAHSCKRFGQSFPYQQKEKRKLPFHVGLIITPISCRTFDESHSFLPNFSQMPFIPAESVTNHFHYCKKCELSPQLLQNVWLIPVISAKSLTKPLMSLTNPSNLIESLTNATHSCIRFHKSILFLQEFWLIPHIPLERV